MKVVNKDILPVCVQIKGIRYVIPGDRKVYYLPDEAYEGYKDLFFVVVPPQPKSLDTINFQKYEPILNPVTSIQEIKIDEKKKRISNPGGNPYWSKYLYDIVDPDMNEFKNISLLTYCKLNNLKYIAMYGACKSGRMYKGYKVTRHLKEGFKK